MKRRNLVYGVALAGAAALFVFGDNTPDSAVAEAVERAPAAPRQLAPVATTSAPAGLAEPLILRVQDRAELVGDDDDAQAGAVFGSQDWTPAPAVQPPQPAPPPPPPTAPALPFTYLGKALSDGAIEVFLARSGTTYIVRENMVIDGIYRVDAIAPPMLKLTYLPLNQAQQINIGVLE